MTSSRLIAIGAMLLLGGPALAQGTAAQRAACTPDAMRLCAAHIPDAGAIAACLRGAGPRVSPACRTAMGEAPAPAVAEARPLPPRTAARREAPPRVGEAAPSRRRAAAGGIAEARILRRPAAARVRREEGRYAEHRPRRRFAGLGRYGSEMAEARYWMRTLGGMGLGSAVAGYLPPEMSGLSMETIAGMLE